MAKQRAASILAAALLLLAAFFAAFPAVVQSIGVCYGVNGKTLPTASDVVQLYRSKGINAMRIYFPESKVLHALTGTGIALVMDVANGDVGTISSGASAAAAWVKANVQAYPGVSFKYIAVGNEVMGADAQSKILPAMKNLHGALSAAGLGGMIKVSTAVRFDVITNSYPPSYGVFKDFSVMSPIAEFLNSTGGPFLANVYPYFAYRDDPQNIKLEYATFLPGTTVTDDNGLNYTNLFDAMVDAAYAALEDAGTPDVRVVVSESGWPSTGGFGATVSNARTYNQKLINHVGEGTPRRPGPLETYMFAMFNENLKTGDETEKHFGLFNPDKSPAYPISF